MLCFVINLKKETERFKSIDGQLSSLGINYELVEAVSKDSIPSSVRFKNTKDVCSRDLTKGEIGCYLSHIECWKRLVKSEEKWALILEDDAKLNRNIKAFISDSCWIPDGVQIIQLYSGPLNKKTVLILDKQEIVGPDNKGCLLRQIKPLALTTTGYLISKSAAEKAIQSSSVITEPVDEFLFNPFSKFYKECLPWKLDPSLVTDLPFSSAIQTERVKQKICEDRNLKFFYRKYKLSLIRLIFGRRYRLIS